MLNKIRNIEPGTDYNRTGKFKGYENSSRIVDSSLISISDSKEFSPALEFLAKINWKLKTIKFIDKDRIILALRIKKYEISTVLDLVNIFSIKEIKYDIVCEIDEYGSQKSYSAKFNSLVFTDKTFNPNSPVNLEPLDNLFEHFTSLKINSVLKQSDTTLVKNLVEDIRKELEELFGYINEIFLTFVRQLLQLKNKGVSETKNFYEESVTLISINSSTT